MGRAELQFQNFTRGGLKVELCQSERSLRKVWQFRAAIFRGEIQREDRDIWDETYLNFCIKCVEKMQFSDKTLSKTSLKYELSETIDSSENILSAHTEDVLSGTLNFNKGDNIIILDGQGKTYRGLEGDDTYFISQLLPKSGKVSITDTEGSNLVQLPANTYIDKSLFTKNAARLTLEDGREITISGADKFLYNVGGNITDGTKGTDLTFTEFAEVFGVYDILNSSGAQTGAIADMYII